MEQFVYQASLKSDKDQVIDEVYLPSEVVVMMISLYYN
jgi:hypothetical protein